MKKHVRRAVAMAAALACAVAAAGCGPQAGEDRTTRTRFLLGTVVTLTAYQSGAEETLDRAFERIGQIEDEMSAHKPDSQIGRLNAEGTARLTADVFFVLERALSMAALSGGAFDPTVLPLSRLWGIDGETKQKKVPPADEVGKARALVDYKKVALDGKTGTATLKKGMGVDLGGIAKGYAADEAWRIFREDGVKSAVLDLGGNVVAIGTRPDGRPWRIGVRDPRAQPEGAHYAVLALSDEAAVTSGDYQRYFEADGVRYHHIFDTSTGYPARNGVVSATIVSKDSTTADALSTAVFVLGVEKGLALVESVEGTEALVVTEDKKVYATPGIRDRVEMASTEYTLQ